MQATLFHLEKSAFNRRFFVSVVSIFLIQLLTWPSLTILTARAETPNIQCAPSTAGETTLVEYVIDGDTIVLADQRRVRLIGIDTPEIGHDGRPSEPGAIPARDFLRKLLTPNPEIQLVYDQEHFDRHGRTLAHLFLPDATNVQARLLQEGMATPLTIPPNLQFTDCYQQQSGLAMRQGKGLWAWERYQPLAVTDLTGTERGYHIIKGQVIRVTESRSSLWIQLQERFALRIQSNDSSYFNLQDLRALPGKTVQARGWIYRRNNELRMQIRHPVDLQITAEGQGN